MRQVKEKEVVEFRLPSEAKSEQLRSPRASGVRHKRDPIMVLAQGNSDREALNSLVSEWLVPLLVREFLADQQTKITVKSNEPTSCPVSKGGAASSRIRN